MTARDPVLDQLYRRLMTRIDSLADRLVGAINEAEGSYREAGSVSATDLRRSCRDNILAVLQILSGSAPVGVDVLDAPRSTGRRRAQQRMPLDAVLHSFRIGGRVIWEELAAEARRGGTAATDAVLDGATSVWEVVDRVSSEVADTYRAAEQELLRTDSARTGAVLEALISGRGREPGVAAEASRTLGLPSAGGFAVVVVAAPPDGPRSLRGVASLLDTKGMPSAWHRWPDHEVGVVGLAGADVDELQAALRGFPLARIGVSAAIDTLADVQQGHLQAGTALATLPVGRAGVVALEDVLPAALLIAQPDLGQRLVHVVLGDVLALPGPDRDLMLETMRAWLAAEGSPSATAAALYCHRNTVLNRLRRIEILIGRSTESTATRVELSLALTALEVLPWDRAARRTDHPADLAAG